MPDFKNVGKFPLITAAVAAFAAVTLTAPVAAHSAQSKVYAETVGGVSHTWTNYRDAGGTPGQVIASHTTVQVSCRTRGFKVSDGNVWWYRLASTPWKGHYYVSADAFYNDGETSGSLLHTPFYDPKVPLC